MKVVRDIRRFPPSARGAVVGIGVFDGVHRGHQRLLGRVVRIARAEQWPAGVITFHPHPARILHPHPLPLLMSLSFRLQVLAALGIDWCFVQHFTRAFARMSPETFVERRLVRTMETAVVVVGADFRFGAGRGGDLKRLADLAGALGFRLEVVSVGRGGVKSVGSTPIRRLITSGRLREASALLGRPVAVMGRVVRGDRRGRCLGYPTANVAVSDVVLPPSGVYAAEVFISDRAFPAIANIGIRPSFTDGGWLTLEVHVLDFDGDLYGRELVVAFHRRLRGERRFASAEGLVRRLAEDEARTRAWFARRQRREIPPGFLPEGTVLSVG